MNETENIPQQVEQTDTENPLLATATTHLDKKAYHVVYRPARIFTYCVYAFCVAAFIYVLYLYIQTKFQISPLYFISILAIFIVAVLAFTCLQIQYKQLYTKGIVEKYTFYKQYIVQHTIRNAEVVGELKHFYQDIVRASFIRTRGRAGYLLLYRFSAQNVLLMDLEGMPEQEQANLAKLFKVKIKR